jgi:hypothetical protein
MTLPGVRQARVDGALGIVPPSAAGVNLLIGSCAGLADRAPRYPPVSEKLSPRLIT